MPTIPPKTKSKYHINANEKNGRWKDNNVAYRTLHNWLVYNYGKANCCEFNITHKSTRYHWANISKQYLRDRNDYIQLCPKCHFKFDGRIPYGRISFGRKIIKQSHCKYGHEYTTENTRIHYQGHRVCKSCQREYIKNYYQRKE